MPIKLEITRERPEDRPEVLAPQLAQALQNSIEEKRVAAAFTEQAVSEKRKVVQFQQTIIDLEHYLANRPDKPSRMEPMETYDLEALQTEMKQAEDRVVEFQEEAEAATKRARDYELEVAALQARIHESRNGNKG